MAVYMKGTRRAEEMLTDARQLAYQEQYSYTEGWDDNTVIECMNLGMGRLYDALTQIDSPANIEELILSTVAGQQEYDIPQAVKLAVSIMDVRFIYGSQAWEFNTLNQGMIQDRFPYPTNFPDTYCIRNGKMVISPIPNITRANNLIINFQKRMRKIDIRRGKVSNLISAQGGVSNIISTSTVEIITDTNHGLTTGKKVGITGVFEPSQLNERAYFITVTGLNSFILDGVDGSLFPAFTGTASWFLNPLQFQLNFNVLSQKDVNLQANANSILDKTDWACFCNRDGEPVIDAIPLNGYNMNTFILTADPNYVIPAANLDAFNYLINNEDIVYVLSGDYSSSHTQLDRQVEDHLIEYTILRLLRLQSAAEPTQDQRDAEEAVLQRLRLAYRRYRPSIVPIVWQNRRPGNSGIYNRRGIR